MKLKKRGKMSEKVKKNVTPNPVSSGVGARIECAFCLDCGKSPKETLFSRNQFRNPNGRCVDCIRLFIEETEAKRKAKKTHKQLKCCIQCYQFRNAEFFSKRQFRAIDGKCKQCVTKLELLAASHAADKWRYNCYFRCVRKGKNGGYNVQKKPHFGSPIVGTVLIGTVLLATDIIRNDKGDGFVKLHPDQEGLIQNKTQHFSSMLECWVACRTLNNELILERHRGGMKHGCRFFQCVVENCKVRPQPDILVEENIDYLEYGDVVEVNETILSKDGLIFLRLNEKYFHRPMYVVENSLDNETVMLNVDGPSDDPSEYLCVQLIGAPARELPSLDIPPITRIPCGAVVLVSKRIVTEDRQIFLQVSSFEDYRNVWVIATSTCCASVMKKIESQCKSESVELVASKISQAISSLNFNNICRTDLKKIEASLENALALIKNKVETPN